MHVYNNTFLKHHVIFVWLIAQQVSHYFMQTNTEIFTWIEVWLWLPHSHTLIFCLSHSFGDLDVCFGLVSCENSFSSSAYQQTCWCFCTKIDICDYVHFIKRPSTAYKKAGLKHDAATTMLPQGHGVLLVMCFTLNIPFRIKECPVHGDVIVVVNVLLMALTVHLMLGRILFYSTSDRHFYGFTNEMAWKRFVSSM